MRYNYYSVSNYKQLTVPYYNIGETVYISGYGPYGFRISKKQSKKDICKRIVQKVGGSNRINVKLPNEFDFPNGFYWEKKLNNGDVVVFPRKEDIPEEANKRYSRKYNVFSTLNYLRLSKEYRDVYFGKAKPSMRTMYTIDTAVGLSYTAEQVDDVTYGSLKTLKELFPCSRVSKIGLKIQFKAPDSYDKNGQFYCPSFFINYLGSEINNGDDAESGMKFEVSHGKLVVSRHDYECPVTGITEAWVDNRPDNIHLCKCCEGRATNAYLKDCISQGNRGKKALRKTIAAIKDKTRKLKKEYTDRQNRSISVLNEPV